MNIQSSFAAQLYASARRMAPVEAPVADAVGKAGEDARGAGSFADALAIASSEMTEPCAPARPQPGWQSRVRATCSRWSKR
jgi:hypothetical protein